MPLLYVKPRLLHRGYIDLYSLFYIKVCMALTDALESHIVILRSRGKF